MPEETTNKRRGCPECGSLAATITGRFVTAMMPRNFRDEHGRDHYHDPNISTIELTCSKCQHRYRENEMSRCWCEANDA